MVESPDGRLDDVSIVMAAYVLSLGFDFFLHAGVLAGLYVRESPFLLPAEAAFARIPAGYLGFLLLTAGLFWLLRRLDVAGWWDGFRLGVGIGAFVWVALALGLWSISTADPDLLLGWGVGQAFELGLAGAVLGSRLGGTPTHRVWLKVVIGTLLLVIATIALQTLGLAPAAR